MEQTELIKKGVTVLNYVGDLERKGEENSNADSAKEENNNGALNTRTGILMGVQVNHSFLMNSVCLSFQTLRLHVALLVDYYLCLDCWVPTQNLGYS